jgi:hypothetical protein
MGAAPVIHWIRPGVGYAPDAADSMRRLEFALGRQHDCNSSYRDYDKQLGYYDAWNAYAYHGGPKPPHSRAIHPDYSMHCRGLADDSDDWTTPGYIELAAEHGWIRTAASDPTERHHFEYQAWRDQHRNDPVPERKALFSIETMMNEQKRRAKATYPLIPDIAEGVEAIARELPKLRQTHTRAGDASTKATQILQAIAESPEFNLSDDDVAAIASSVVVQLDGRPDALAGFSDEDIERLTKAVNDERDNRELERLQGGPSDTPAT